MSEVQICNQALSLLGASLITSLDDDTNEAKLCKLHYANLRDTIQESHSWTFCIAWVELPALADPPLSEYANAYELPTDALRVLFVGQDYKNPESYQVEGNAIVTDAVSAKAQIVRRIEDTNQFSPMFEQALIARLAAELAIPITNSRTLAEQHFAIYRGKMDAAMTKDNQQGRPRRIRSTWLNGSRAQGPRGFGPYV